MSTWRRLAVSGLVALSACGEASPLRDASTTRDSAGIRIVDNQVPADTVAPWTLDPVATIDLGGHATDPNQEFSGFVFPLFLSDGRLVVASGGSYELRFFGPDGTWQQSVGRRGSGPGEFEGLGWLSAGVGDTLRTYDWNTRRLTVFSPTGVFVRQAMLAVPDAQAAPRPVGVLADGRLVAQSQAIVTPSSRPGVRRDTLPLLVYSASGAVNDSLGRFPGSEYLVETGPGSVSVSSRPFGKDLFVAVHQARVYVGTADQPEFVVVGAEGRVVSLVRWRAAPVEVTPADVESYVSAFGEGWRSGEEAVRDRFLAMARKAPFPTWKPAYGGMIVSRDGSVWVRTYTEPANSAPTSFEVFDPTGRWLGLVEMPTGFEPTQVTSELVVGTWKDPDDVPHVRAYRLRRHR